MFTVCPKCALTLVVTAADLRVAQGYVRCGRCSNVFNALARLSDDRPPTGHASPASQNAVSSPSTSQERARSGATSTRNRQIDDPSSTASRRQLADPSPSSILRRPTDPASTGRHFLDPAETATWRRLADPPPPSRDGQVPDTSPTERARQILESDSSNTLPAGEVSGIAAERHHRFDARVTRDDGLPGAAGSDADEVPDQALEFDPNSDVSQVFLPPQSSARFEAATGTFNALRRATERRRSLDGLSGIPGGANPVDAAPEPSPAERQGGGMLDARVSGGDAANASTPDAGGIAQGGTDNEGYLTGGRATEGTGADRPAADRPAGESLAIEGATPEGFAEEGPAAAEGSLAEVLATEGSAAEGAAVRGPELEGPAADGSAVEDSGPDGLAPDGLAAEGSAVDAVSAERSASERASIEGTSTPVNRTDSAATARAAGGSQPFDATVDLAAVHSSQDIDVGKARAEVARAALESSLAIRSFMNRRKPAVEQVDEPGMAARPLARRWAAGCAGLAVLLLVQIVHHSRSDLATYSALRRPLTALYSVFGVTLIPNWSLDAYEVQQLGASIAADAPGEITVRAGIRNIAHQSRPLPLLRVTLQDRFGNRIAFRDVPPQSYLPRGARSMPTLSPGARVEAEMTFLDPGANAVGFEIDACLLAPAGGMACADESAR